LTELLCHGEQLAIRRFQALVDRCLEAVQLAGLFRCQGEAPILLQQFGAPLVR
jgi:hypothetical protein